ncbi:hypothetical protein C6P77_25680 [Burkholderia ambifaria]|nr:hypothetical protein C6P77_25680 [Burkholderia ambifaria]
MRYRSLNQFFRILPDGIRKHKLNTPHCSHDLKIGERQLVSLQPCRILPGHNINDVIEREQLGQLYRSIITCVVEALEAYRSKLRLIYLGCPLATSRNE